MDGWKTFSFPFGGCENVSFREGNIAGWKMDPLKMHFFLNMGMFQPAMFSLPEGNERYPYRRHQRKRPNLGFDFSKEFFRK